MSEARELPPLLERFAALLDYPTPALHGQVAELRRTISAAHPEAAALLGPLDALAGSCPPGQLEELHTATFELPGRCPPYVGHHLLGESPRRSALLVGLSAMYRARGFAPGRELPDHLCVVLRYLAHHGEGEEAEDLLGTCVVPALRLMIGVFAEPSGPEHEMAPISLHPYRGLLEALSLLLPRREAR